MPVTFNLPEKIEKQLAAEWGKDLSRAALEGLVAEAARGNLLSTGQIAELLQLSIDGANGFLKERGILPDYSPEDLEADVESLRAMLDKQPART